jgi:alkylation response protein AidB-like acyl-CoA dehydrogenase
MDIDFSPEDMAFQQEVRTWFKAHTPSDLKRKTVTGEMLQKNDIVQWQRRLDGQGWLVTGWPKEHGGPGWTPTQRYIFDLERAAASAPVGLSMGVIMLGPVLIAFGTPEQKAQYLPRIRRCEDWWCQGYSEPGAGSDLASLKTTAVADGSDYIINGSKIWTTYAHWATHMFCLVRTANTGKKQEGISFLLIEMDRSGIDVKPIVSIDGEHHLNQVFLTDVRVPRKNLVGREGQGWDIAKYLLTHERTSIAGVADCKAPGPESSLLTPMGTAVEQRLAELDVEIAAEQAWPWHETGELGGGRFSHAMSRYCFSRAATIYGGSDEVQKNVLAKMLLAGAR